MNELCEQPGCSEKRVSGAAYCEDHLLQLQVASRPRQQPAVVGTLAQLIRSGVAKGLIQPVRSGYQSAP
jgi:hypothetical protein